MMPLPTSRQEKGWRARLALLFAVKRGRTELVRRRHEGPLYVQRVFHPEGDDALHAYLLHPPGGLVGGDELEIEVRVERAARVLLTTPAAQKLYRSSGAEAAARTRLFVEAGARLEWFPAETIAFEGSRARLDTRIELAPGAAFCGWDIGCLGRPTAGEHFTRGRLRTSFTLSRSEPLLSERLLFEGGSPVLHESWGLAGHNVYGNLYCVPADPARLTEACELLRRELAAFGGKHAVTVIDGVLALRALGARCEHVRTLLIQAWTLLRPLAFDVRAQQPRIWST